MKSFVHSITNNKEHFLKRFSWRFSSNSEADASENLHEMFPQYYMHSNVLITHNYSTTQLHALCFEGIQTTQ